MSFTEAMRCGRNDHITHPSSVGGYKIVVCCIYFFHRKTKLHVSHIWKEFQIGKKETTFCEMCQKHDDLFWCYLLLVLKNFQILKLHKYKCRARTILNRYLPTECCLRASWSFCIFHFTVNMWDKEWGWRFFVFEFPCIISLYYIKKQQDATLAVLFISNCKITLHVSDPSRVRHQEYKKL